jgi:hypothetical protein
MRETKPMFEKWAFGFFFFTSAYRCELNAKLDKRRLVQCIGDFQSVENMNIRGNRDSDVSLQQKATMSESEKKKKDSSLSLNSSKECGQEQNRI